MLLHIDYAFVVLSLLDGRASKHGILLANVQPMYRWGI